MTESSQNGKETSRQEDIFEKHDLISAEEASLKTVQEAESPNDVPKDFDDLPVELISLVDRFVDSLGAKVYNTPPSAEKLSTIFQDFYVTASSHIATHISALSTQQSRASSPHTSGPSKTFPSRAMIRSVSRDALSPLGGPPPEQQMLTPQEISSRRKARRLLDKKGTALEEAVERRVCERVYNRIWRHKSTLDEMRDEKLRSRTAALAVVGIGLGDLGVDIVQDESKIPVSREVEDWITQARGGLLRMNDARFPLGKLQQLAEAHKIIVDMLTDVHNSSSSADEILPTLIYTLITSPPEGINVVSNLEFIQRFRTSSKIDGEAAYCLTNLEAAISFLETVDLASLRENERPRGSTTAIAPNGSVPSQGEILPPPTSNDSHQATKSIPRSETSTSELSESSTAVEASISQSRPQAPSHRRRVSDMFQPPVAAIGAAGDAVRSTADQGIKGIGHALDNSFKLLFGRLGEQKVASPDPNKTEFVAVPKTLDDARKLVEPKPADSESILTEASSLDEGIGGDGRLASKGDDSLLSAIAGKKQFQRERSDSNQSARSSQFDSTPAANGAIETVKNFSNNFNPLKGFGGMNVIRGFARTPSSGNTPLATPNASNNEGLLGQRPGSPAKVMPAGIKTLPPIQRFMDTADARELKVGDVSELLEDYKRLAEALRTLGAI